MAEDHGVTSLHKWIHVRDIVAHGIPFPLVIVMLPGHPLGFFTRILYEFVLVKSPNDATVPVDLDKIHIVLHAVGRVSFTRTSDKVALRQKPVGHAVKPLP